MQAGRKSKLENCLVATFISNSPGDTQKIGCQLAAELRAGNIVALIGQLGSGKTQFVKGLAAGMDARDEVTSPTFTLIHEYAGGPIPLYHFDFFRLEDRRSAERLGLEEYFFGDGICVVEWADKFPELIPPGAVWISFETKSETERLIILR